MQCPQVTRGHLLLASLVVLASLAYCAQAGGSFNLFKPKVTPPQVSGNQNEAAAAAATTPRPRRQRINVKELARDAKQEHSEPEGDGADELVSTGPRNKKSLPALAGNFFENFGKKNKRKEQSREGHNKPTPEPEPEPEEYEDEEEEYEDEEEEEPEPSTTVRPTGSARDRIRQRQSIRPNLGGLKNTRETGRPVTPIASPIKREKTGFFAKKFKTVMKDAVQVSKDAYQVSKVAIKKLPQQIKVASDSMSAYLKLDNKGRMLALIEEADADIKFVKTQFSQFSIDWTPLMERGLSYLGTDNLDKVEIKPVDELDHRRDAIHLLVFGYEMMRLMAAWRNHMLTAHQAYRIYLETVKHDMIDGKAEKKANVDKYFIFQLHTIHNYLVLTSWIEFEAETLETRMKLDYLMTIEDETERDYESDYFRGIVQLQEIYEPTATEFEEEKEEVLVAVTRDMCTGPDDARLQMNEPLDAEVDISTVTCVSDEDMENVDDFFDSFRDGDVGLEAAKLTLPRELLDFQDKLKPQLQYNALVYNNKFLKELKRAREEAARKRREE